MAKPLKIVDNISADDIRKHSSNDMIVFDEEELSILEHYAPHSTSTLSGQETKEVSPLEISLKMFDILIKIDNSVHFTYSKMCDTKQDSEYLDILNRFIDREISMINPILRLLGNDEIEKHELDMLYTILDIKERSYYVLGMMFKELGFNKKITFNASPAFPEISELLNGNYAYISGSYVKHRFSDNANLRPKDIDGGISYEDMSITEYASIFENERKIDGISYVPALIPKKYFHIMVSMQYKKFFDRRNIPINKDLTIHFPDDEQDIAAAIASLYLIKQREYTLSDIMKDHRIIPSKISSRVRKAHEFYLDYGGQFSIPQPRYTKPSYNTDMTTEEVINLMAESSIELSNMMKILEH